MDYDLTVKTILIGDSSVGKSSLLYRYTDDDWNPYYIATIGVDFKVRTMERSGKVIKLQLWDTAGQERFRSITQSYYKGAHAVALVFDVNDRESFDSLRIWINDVHNFGTANVPVVLLGNKCDMIPRNGDRRAVGTEEAQQFADGLGFKYFETSAKNGTNVSEAFEHIVERCVDQREKVIGGRRRNADGVILPSREITDPAKGKKDSLCGCN